MTNKERDAIGQVRGVERSLLNTLIRDLTKDEQIEIGIAGILAVMQVMRAEHVCDGDLSILVEGDQQENVANLNKITCRDIRLLGSSWYKRKDDTAGSGNTTIVDSLVSKGLSLFGINAYNNQNVLQDRLKAYIRLCALAIMSHIGSHCIDFRQLVWPSFQPSKSVTEDSGTQIRYERTPITCLEDSIGAPIFVFRTGSVVPQALSLQLADYVDLWGPPWAHSGETTNE